jgi:hypothetical protein
MQDKCPANANEFGEILKGLGGHLEPTMVNFGGFHNPASGAFFIFEIVSTAANASLPAPAIERGDLVFGHFLEATNDGRLVSSKGQLLIELIAWDPDKQFYNFYELVRGDWFYRGDSKDILDDIELLHRQRDTNVEPFGARLRCSGCHVNGGLVQKELAAPHNDWFLQSRNLPLGVLKPDPFVKQKFRDLVDASELSRLVTASARRLADSPGYRKALATRNMQVQLRPLFCPVELNIESDPEPFDDRKPALHVPSAFFADPGAPELLGNLTDPQRNAAFHEKQAVAFLANCQKRAAEPATVQDWFRLLAQRRVEVEASEISQNRRGKILESPERTVFPSTQPKAAAGRLAMTQACQVQ